jgi:hypothetical protein
MFEKELEEAATEAYTIVLTRYDRKPKLIDIRVQHGKVNISQLMVSFAGGELKIRGWRCNDTSPLYRVYLGWRYLIHGRVLDYYAKLDPELRLPEFKMEQLILRKDCVGLPEPEEVMRSAKFVPKTVHDDIKDRIRAQAVSRSI